MFNNFNFYMPTKIYYGADKIDLLKTLPLPGRHALIVTTNGGSVRKNGTLDRVTAGLKQQNVSFALFDEISSNPDIHAIVAGAAFARKEQCDFIIGLGGGSAIDASKAIAVLTKNGDNFWDFIQRGSGGRQFPANGALPIIAIPTTAGTGTEADPWLVASNPKTHEKIGCGWDFTYPFFSIVDPTLMLSVPPVFTAMQGMDAFFHAAEGYIATCATPVSEMFSLQSIALIAKSLPAAVADGSDLSARADVAWASTAAGIVESLSDTISQHYISHAITALHENIPHGGALIALCIPYFSCLMDAIPEKFARMAVAMGAEDNFSTPEDGARCFIHMLRTLIQNIGMGDYDLKTLGVMPEEAAEICRKAYQTDGHLFSITPADISEEKMTEVVASCIRRDYL